MALCFAVVILLVAALFAWFFHRHAKVTLRVASLQGHYHFLFPYEILGTALTRHIAALSAGGLAASLLVFMVIQRRIHCGVERLVNVFRLSVEGDLSTPTEPPGQPELTGLGRKIDAARSRTLSRIRAANDEAKLLLEEPLSEEEFARRWDALKHILQRIVP
jgi:methyl-accepting chemotaxis protein